MAEQPDSQPRTFAQLLDHLWQTVHPLGKPYTYEQVAAGVAAAGGEISVAYLWQLRKGERTNPTLQHIQALATFFGVPAAYFLDPEQERRINQHLDLLSAMRDTNVRNIALRAHGLGERELAALNAMVTSLREAKGLDDPDP
ncbi:helix-turn-helix domain-containing protein [Leekyejoonella antrihumi]|uniref:Helix-turn-helix transcriptional regulator n=1 Tax=Leekyejoonella antrihumi TaxID=1660198 RepID=A0A563DXR2_9MICO|nr:helix-turn-helix transcriptional regulator [Leekyejoonella antrihumi]TWP34464.1 helix-turn-helix transcriptional regulator [Leekyejoonella antrihumi]